MMESSLAHEFSVEKKEVTHQQLSEMVLYVLLKHKQYWQKQNMKYIFHMQYVYETLKRISRNHSQSRQAQCIKNKQKSCQNTQIKICSLQILEKTVLHHARSGNTYKTMTTRSVRHTFCKNIILIMTSWVFNCISARV